MFRSSKASAAVRAYIDNLTQNTIFQDSRIIDQDGLSSFTFSSVDDLSNYLVYYNGLLLTQIGTLAALVITNIIPLWILLVVLFKEFIMICGASFLYGKDVVVYSKWYGKLATVLLYLAIFVIKKDCDLFAIF